jgi:acetyl-CoA carboxylase/biotin carboxylase 1
MLFGVYQQVAVHFADLHDTPGRMKAKGVIRRKVQWAESRKFFYWRLQRRLLEFDIAKQLLVKGARGSDKVSDHRKTTVAELQTWFLEQGGSAELWEEDKEMMGWFDAHKTELQAYISGIKNAQLVSQIGLKLGEIVVAASAEGDATQFLKQAFQSLSAEDRQQILAALN